MGRAGRQDKACFSSSYYSEDFIDLQLLPPHLRVRVTEIAPASSAWSFCCSKKVEAHSCVQRSIASGVALGKQAKQADMADFAAIAAEPVFNETVQALVGGLLPLWMGVCLRRQHSV